MAVWRVTQSRANRARTLLLGAFLVFFVSPCIGQSVPAARSPAVHTLAPDSEPIELTTAALRLDDATGKMTAQEVEAALERGGGKQIASLTIRDYSFRPQRAIWLRFDVAATQAMDRLLAVGRPELLRVQVFTRSPAGEWTSSYALGDDMPYATRPIPNRNFIFPVHLARGASVLLVRVQIEGPTEIRASLLSEDALRDRDESVINIASVFFGVLGGLTLYNLLLYVMVKDRGYLFYVGAIIAAMLGHLGQTGLGVQYVYGDSVWWSGRFLGLAWALGSYFRVALSRHFLATRQRLPWADRVLQAFGWMSLLTCVLAVSTPRYVIGVPMLVAGLGSSFFIDVVSVIGVIRRWPGAPYYLASWIALSAGVVVQSSRYAGVLPTNLLTSNALALGAAVSYVLLSIALAHQINEEKRLKEQAQAHSLAVLQASQALGSESRLDALIARVRVIMAQLTGATHVHLALRDLDLKAWFVEAGENERLRIPLDDDGARKLVPVSVVRHVESSGEPLLIADASRDERFAGDPAIAAAETRSLLAVPVVQHGELRAVLVLENRLKARAFSASDIETLASIAGPLALAVENALFYERLEQRVAEQTRELRETQERLVTMARRAGMAEIATNVLHNMGNILNSVNVEADLLRSRLHESKLTGVSRAAALLDEHSGDPGAFMNTEKGKLLPGYLRELGAALDRERADMLERIERLLASVEHIKNVVATQQAFAGSSVFTERLRPAEVVEEALRITGDSLRRHRIEVVKEVEEVPPLQLDKTRALQILVNLINNARQAIDAAEGGPRELHLRMDADGEKLRFQVRDDGCGIPRENLSRIFSHGFTTRSDGHGFGLHSSALAAGEMGGKLSVFSEGSGLGATFTLELPLQRA